MAASQSPEHLPPELWRLLELIVQNPRQILADDPELAHQLALDAQRLSPEELIV